MSSKAMSLKAKIKNLSKEKGISAQVFLQNYMLRRGQLNTRPRDFYDVYILAKTQPYDRVLFYEALKRTSEHRASIHILSNISRRIYELSESETLKERWIKYTKNYKYAVNISYENIIDVLNNLFQSRENI